MALTVSVQTVWEDESYIKLKYTIARDIYESVFSHLF